MPNARGFRGTRSRTVRLIGLTGGIATGKSTAARFFVDAGARLIDADDLSRRVVERGRPAIAEIRTAFGGGVIRSDGTLDRDALGGLIFADPEARARLNSILHPKIADEAREEIQRFLSEDPQALVVYDVPLLFETGMEDRFDLVAVIYLPRTEQEKRLIARNGLTREQAAARIASQMDIEEKVRRADVVIDNRGTVDELREQVIGLVETVRERNKMRNRG
jgi:dephospho-CoA kinase